MLTECSNSAVRSIADEVAAYQISRSNLPISGSHATAKLLAKSLSLTEIEQRREAFLTTDGVDRTAILANYDLLHGIRYIDGLDTRREFPLDARVITSIFRGCEVCLLNLSVLCHRTTQDIALAQWGHAAVKMTWINHFTETLHKLSQLLIRIDYGASDGDSLSIEDSPGFIEYRRTLSGLHETLRTHHTESIADLAGVDIDDPRRFVSFHAFVNTNYDAIWRSILRDVRLPGVFREEHETPTLFFDRIIECSAVRSAVMCVDLRDDTYLMQFRAYHQISEILVRLINAVACDIILTLIDETRENLATPARTLAICNATLQVVTDNIKPIVRTLSPTAYLAIRPALGITSGSHSHNLRKGLFLTVYPLLVRAFRLRLSAFDECDARDDAKILESARRVLRSDDHHGHGSFLRNLVYVHQSVRTWRDEHIQFVKTQIGVGHETPTASISGSENAAETAHNFRKVHANDLIGPLYEALLGRRPPTPLPLVRPGEYDDYMANFTATAVESMYADIQARVHRRRSELRE